MLYVWNILNEHVRCLCIFFLFVFNIVVILMIMRSSIYTDELFLTKEKIITSAACKLLCSAALLHCTEYELYHWKTVTDFFHKEVTDWLFILTLQVMNWWALYLIPNKKQLSQAAQSLLCHHLWQPRPFGRVTILLAFSLLALLQECFCLTKSKMLWQWCIQQYKNYANNTSAQWC